MGQGGTTGGFNCSIRICEGRQSGWVGRNWLGDGCVPVFPSSNSPNWHQQAKCLKWVTVWNPIPTRHRLKLFGCSFLLPPPTTTTTLKSLWKIRQCRRWIRRQLVSPGSSSCVCGQENCGFIFLFIYLFYFEWDNKTNKVLVLQLESLGFYAVTGQH